MSTKLMAFAGGALMGFGAAYLALEDRFGKKYAEMANANQRAYEMAQNIATPENIDYNDVAISVDNLVDDAAKEVLESNTGPFQIFDAGKVERPDIKTNPYHKAVNATATTPEQFVEGGVNDYGVSYIEEEEYFEEDGRTKIQMELLMDEHNPVFTIDGDQVPNWDEMVGDSILVDFYKLVPPGVDPILYVRNHKTDVDYEVIRVEP